MFVTGRWYLPTVCYGAYLPNAIGCGTAFQFQAKWFFTRNGRFSPRQSLNDFCDFQWPPAPQNENCNTDRSTILWGEFSDRDYNHGQKVSGHFCTSRAFSNSHRSNPSPHLTNNVGRVYPAFFFEFQLCVGWGEGELQENFEKDALFHEGIEKWQKNLNVALLSQGR